MKLGILTQRLHVNYGGLLQCFALQTVLSRMGHEAEVLQRVQPKYKRNLRNRILQLVKQLGVLCLQHRWHHYTSAKEDDIIAQHTRKFIERYINPRSPFFYDTSSLKTYTMQNCFGGYVVGSDQVWRPCYSPCIGNYFLDFANGQQVKRISYAASFGVDTNEYTPVQQDVCKRWLQEFNGISVREQSGIQLCKDIFGAEAQLVLDPTLLLSREDYIRIVDEENETQSPGNLFCYILDESPVKIEAIRAIEQRLQMTAFRVMPKRTDTEHLHKADIKDFVYPSVTKWLRAFMDAEMVLTDSFHGCVFSIIFNKPFWVIGNEGRGLARFHSLLALFGLDNRLLTLSHLASNDWTLPINWEAVNTKKAEMQKVSTHFLTSKLS